MIKIKKTKAVLIVSAASVAAAVITVAGISSVRAAAVTFTTNLLRTVSVLGVGLVRSDTYQMQVVDLTDATSTYDVTLPALSGNDGLLYLVKRTPGGSTEIRVAAHPQSGEAIEGVTDGTWELKGGQAVTFAADEDTSTWWVISQISEAQYEE